jgi:hypothetical protein
MMVCTDFAEWPVMAQISAMVAPARANQVTAVSRRSTAKQSATVLWLGFETSAKAAAALEAAADAKRIALEAHTRLAALDASFGLYRERIAAEYVSRAVLREVEDRIGDAIERLGERLDRVFEGHFSK